MSTKRSGSYKLLMEKKQEQNQQQESTSQPKPNRSKSYQKTSKQKHLSSLKRRKNELNRLEKQATKHIKLEKYRKKILSNFYLFAKEFLGFEDLYYPLHKPLCDKIVAKGHNKKLFLLPRGHFKTTLISISYPIFLLCKNPNERIILASATSGKSEENLEEIVQRIRSQKFQSVFGHKIPPPEKWVRTTKTQIRLPRQSKYTGASILCLGVDSTEVGRHASRILIDDPVSQDQVNSVDAREKAWAWFGRQFAVLDPHESEVICLGTRWHNDDTYSRILQRDDWYVEIREYKEHGQFIFPTRFNEDYVKKTIRPHMNDYQFSCFYLNNPIGEGMNPFDVKKFRFEKYPLEDQTINSAVWTYMMVDPATTTKDYSCPSAFVIGDAVNTTRGKKFVVRRVISQKLAPDNFVDFIFMLHRKYKFKAVGIESQAQQATLHYWLKREQQTNNEHFEILEVRNKMRERKEKSIWGLQPFLHNHAIIFDEAMEGKKELVDEFQNYPKGKTDDIILAMSFVPEAVSYPSKFSREDRTSQYVPKQSRLLKDLIERPKRKKRTSRRMPNIRKQQRVFM